MADKKPIVWTLEQALTLIRSLQPSLRSYGFHLCLGGGVLNAGESRKDLDLYFLPLDNTGSDADVDGLVNFLSDMWGIGVPLSGSYEAPTNSPYTQCLEFKVRHGRIDVFIIGHREVTVGDKS